MKDTQYATDANLAKRIALHRYGSSGISWYDWYFNVVGSIDGARVLDVGCGNAAFWRGRQVQISALEELHLVDLSPGMIQAARGTFEEMALPAPHFAVAPIEALPFSEESFDVVFANFMLYHCERPEVALRELLRVMRHGGVLFAATNGMNHMRRLREWAVGCGLAAAERLGTPARRFGLDSGSLLVRSLFDEVQVLRFSDDLQVPAIQPIVDYLRSLELSETPETSEGLRCFQQTLQKELRLKGRIRIERESGIIRATAPRI